MSDAGDHGAGWIEDLAESITTRHAEWVRSQKRVRAARSNYASVLGHPCLRYLVLMRTRGAERRPPSDELQAIFLDGHRSEDQVRAMLLNLGFDFSRGGQMRLPDNAYQIGAEIDQYVMHGGSGVAIVDYKRVNEHTYSRLNHWSDFLDPLAYWSKWRDQILLYVFLAEGSHLRPDGGLIVLRMAGSVALKAIAIPMDWQRAQVLTDRAERVNRHVAAGTLPDFCGSWSICRRCDFYGGVCTPQIGQESAIGAIDDPYVVESVDRAVALEGDGRSWSKADGYTKTYFKALAGTKPGEFSYLVGNCMVRVVNVETARGVVQRVFYSGPPEEERADGRETGTQA